jgi:chromosome segregation ATPase
MFRKQAYTFYILSLLTVFFNCSKCNPPTILHATHMRALTQLTILTNKVAELENQLLKLDGKNQNDQFNDRINLLSQQLQETQRKCAIDFQTLNKKIDNFGAKLPSHSLSQEDLATLLQILTKPIKEETVGLAQAVDHTSKLIKALNKKTDTLESQVEDQNNFYSRLQAKFAASITQLEEKLSQSLQSKIDEKIQQALKAAQETKEALTQNIQLLENKLQKEFQGEIDKKIQQQALKAAKETKAELAQSIQLLENKLQDAFQSKIDEKIQQALNATQETKAALTQNIQLLENKLQDAFQSKIDEKIQQALKATQETKAELAQSIQLLENKLQKEFQGKIDKKIQQALKAAEDTKEELTKSIQLLENKLQDAFQSKIDEKIQQALNATQETKAALTQSIQLLENKLQKEFQGKIDGKIQQALNATQETKAALTQSIQFLENKLQDAFQGKIDEKIQQALNATQETKAALTQNIQLLADELQERLQNKPDFSKELEQLDRKITSISKELEKDMQDLHSNTTKTILTVKRNLEKLPVNQALGQPDALGIMNTVKKLQKEFEHIQKAMQRLQDTMAGSNIKEPKNLAIDNITIRIIIEAAKSELQELYDEQILQLQSNLNILKQNISSLSEQLENPHKAK